MVLFIVLCKVVLIFDSAHEANAATGQCFFRFLCGIAYDSVQFGRNVWLG